VDFSHCNMSCGVNQMWNLGRYKSVAGFCRGLMSSMRLSFVHQSAVIVFSDTTRVLKRTEACTEPLSAGEKIAKHIREANLGSLAESESIINPNSGNWIKVWTWNVDWDRVVDLAKAKRKAP
jgi:hypothetical protein